MFPAQKSDLIYRALRVPLLLTVLALLCAPIDGYAQTLDTGQIMGRIVAAESERPIEGALIELLVEGDTLRAVSNGRGDFGFRSVRIGLAMVRAIAHGYREWKGAVDSRSGKRIYVEIRMDVEAIDVDPMVVLMARTRLIGHPTNTDAIPGSVQLLTRRDLDEQVSAFDNVHDFLRQLPGVNVQEEEGYGLRPNIGLRGTGVERSSKITLMEDGVLIAPAPYSAPAAYYFPTAGRMEAIEVRKGSSQIEYGPRTIGGALNLVSTSIPTPRSWALDVAGSENASLRVHARAGDAGSRFGWLVETYQVRTDGFKELSAGGDTGFRVGDYLGKLRFSSRPGASVYQELELKAGYTDHTSNETYLGLTDEDFRTSPLLRYAASQPDVMSSKHSQLQARYFARTAGGLDFTGTLYRNDFGRNWYKLQSVLANGISSVLRDPASHSAELAVLRGRESAEDALRVRANNRDYFSQGAVGVMGVRGGSSIGHDLRVGFRYHEDGEDRFQHEDGYRMSGGAMLMTSSGAPGSQSNRVSGAEALALFITDDISVGPWRFAPGLRFESVHFTRLDYSTNDPDRTAPTRLRENDVSALIPGLGVTFSPAGGTHVFAGVHRGFGPPAPGSAPETEPEESVNYELGVRIRGAGFRTQVSGFISDYTNILGSATLATGESGSGDQFNGGTAKVAGLEVALTYDPLSVRSTPFHLPIQVSYTFTDARFESSFESEYDPWGDVEVGDQLPYLPRHQFVASIGVERLGWRIGVTATGASAMRTVAGQRPIVRSESTDRYMILRLTAEYGLPWQGTIYIGVQNLLDERYVVARRPAGARPGLPRTLTMGYRVER